jgi:hypothetical protein
VLYFCLCCSDLGSCGGIFGGVALSYPLLIIILPAVLLCGTHPLTIYFIYCPAFIISCPL